MVEITFRMVKPADSAMLLKWRNDAESMKNSFHSEPIKQEEHDDWMLKIVKSPDNILLIAELDGKPIGSFRMDKFTIAGVGESPDVRLISYIVAPGLRNKGLGKAIVAEGCVCYGQEYNLIAKIKESNAASRKILEACDFVCLGTVEDDVVAYLRPNDREDTIQ